MRCRAMAVGSDGLDSVPPHMDAYVGHAGVTAHGRPRHRASPDGIIWSTVVALASQSSLKVLYTGVVIVVCLKLLQVPLGVTTHTSAAKASPALSSSIANAPVAPSTAQRGDGSSVGSSVTGPPPLKQAASLNAGGFAYVRHMVWCCAALGGCE